ncbi:L-fucose/L-arabinose isomerase family protein [Pseudothermotoga sp.]|nr:hypothetical protein [Pseudothermotoga sp.]MCX7813435.1 hypothetical protein [Pseudothermotoga sp.]MDW8139577.1 hypothetical protein [Pseudothermotoga sp.]
MKDLKIGIVGLMQPNFRGDKIFVYKRCLEELDELSQEMSFELYYLPELISELAQAQHALNLMIEERVDALFVLNASFASGKLVQVFSKLEVPLCLWSVPEQTSSGPLPQNSFCAMNLNASILKRIDPKRKFKWFYGYPNDELFRTRLSVTVKALKTLKKLRKSRILLVGGHAPGFDNLVYDATLLREKFGITVDEMSFDQFKTMVQSEVVTDRDVDRLLKRHEEIDELSMMTVEKLSAVVNTVERLSREGYQAFAISCWPNFRKELSMVPCASFGLLNDEGIVTACEGDVLGAISMLILSYLADHPSIVLDISSLDLQDGSILFWHCGVGMKSYSKNLKMKKHFNPGPFDPQKGWIEVAAVSEMIVESTHATVLRLTDEGRKFFTFEGEFLSGEKPSFDGSRGWFGRFKNHRGMSFEVLDLVNTIMINGIEHHFAVVRGGWMNEIVEICYWTDSELIDIEPYTVSAIGGVNDREPKASNDQGHS